MLDTHLYLYIFVFATWIVYIFNSAYQNYRAKKLLPNKLIELLTIPFYIFYILTLFILIQKVLPIILTNGGAPSINFKSLEIIILIITGIVFCLFSIILYTYISFFEKSFPSCLAIKNGEQLKGIYNYIRHPSYYIFLFITFGTTLCLLSMPLFIIACINCGCLYFYYMIEENQIKKTNIEYEKYLKRSNRFLPIFFKTKKSST